MKNLLNSILLIVSLCSIILFSSCGDDDSGPSYSFIDQNLQGVIDGISFTSQGGNFEEGFEEGKFSVSIYDISEEGDICDVFGTESVFVLFSIPEEVGLYELSFDLSSFSGQTVTLVNPNGANGIPQNNIASTGAVEILTVSDTEITGRMDARFDGDNNVNGNFTLIFCAE